MYEKLGNGLLRRDYCYRREINPFRSRINPGKRNRGFAKQAVLRIKCQNAYIISARYEKVSCCKISPLQTISKIERVKV